MSQGINIQNISYVEPDKIGPRTRRVTEGLDRTMFYLIFQVTVNYYRLVNSLRPSDAYMRE